ncbi:MAG: phosphoesterase [Sphingobacteriales bacterium]|nr:MAG: phosphoesterase [Sphingobacteriales bacterium]
MHKIKNAIPVIAALFCSMLVQAQKKVQVLSVPGKNEFTKINKEGVSVLPSGRYLQPAGNTVQIAHDPFGMAVSPDGSKTVTLHNGVFTVIDNQTLHSQMVGWIGDAPGADRQEYVLSAYKNSIPSPLAHGSLLGVAFAKQNNVVYLSGGDAGCVIEYDIDQFKRLDSISLNGTVNGTEYGDSFTSDIVYNPSANELLVLDQANYRMVRIDLSTRKITASVPTGRLPFGLSLSPDHHFAFVANVGMYAYPLMPDITKDNYEDMLLPWHPYGNNTPQSINGVKWNGRFVPGLGSPNAPEAMSVYAIDLSNNKVTDRYKPGFLLGQMIEGAEVVGGASPNSLAVGSRYAYVTNASNDNISVIDYRAHKITGHISIKTHAAIDKYRGYLPFGITLSADEKTLYVALLGFNAVAVIDVATQKTKGLIPAGWGPTRVKLSPDEKFLYISSCRGLGAGPNGGKNFVAPVQGTYIGDIQLGTFQKVELPGDATLAAMTSACLQNTFTSQPEMDEPENPLPALPGIRQSPIKYIVYITKENRTYDEVFGQLTSGNGDSSLARFGMNVTLHAKDKTLVHMNIAPNHIKLAKQFAFSDNFYCDSDASIHGHHWMMGVIPNEWVETNSNTDKTAMYFSKAPGRRFPGSTGSMDPEDYAERGGLWEALERSKVPFYNFGEANETAHNRESWKDTATGSGHGVIVPIQKALFPRTSHNYAGFNTHIPDQFRLNQFVSEFTKMWLKGKQKMPSVVTIQLPNDHTSDARPEDGYPFYHSFVADNDLALGGILQFLSHTPYWKNMLVIVTEDDPQGGVDHVDAHRSILMLAGPYVKKGYTSHTHANFGSILKMIYNLTNTPYVNQYDATASSLRDFFTSKPDFTPYQHVYPSTDVFDPKLALKKFGRYADWKKVIKAGDMDDEDELRTKNYLREGEH